jgi:hypothetical protein
MAMSPQDSQFLRQMAQQLDETIRELAKREQGLAMILGAERVGEPSALKCALSTGTPK